MAMQVLSNICEIKFDHPQFIRLAGFILEDVGNNVAALHLYKRVLKLRPDEPQSYLDVAHMQAKLGNHFESLENLNKVVEGRWDPRFSQIEVLALASMAHLASKIDPLQLAASNVPHVVNLVLVNPFQVDLRVLLSWDTNDIDVELHVEEPNGEICHSFHNLTLNGGILSRDFTAGYGPEEYMIKKAISGLYKIYVRLATPRTLSMPFIGIRVRVFTHFGTPLEQEKVTAVLLPTTLYKQRVLISAVNFL